MFEELRRAWHKATDPFEGFLEVLWEVWKKDVARATLMARHSWRDIPQETVQKSLAMQAQTNAANAAYQANRQIDQQLSVNLGMLGIPAGPSIGSGGLFAPSVNPDQLFSEHHGQHPRRQRRSAHDGGHGPACRRRAEGPG